MKNSAGQQDGKWTGVPPWNSAFLRSNTNMTTATISPTPAPAVTPSLPTASVQHTQKETQNGTDSPAAAVSETRDSKSPSVQSIASGSTSGGQAVDSPVPSELLLIVLRLSDIKLYCLRTAHHALLYPCSISLLRRQYVKILDYHTLGTRIIGQMRLSYHIPLVVYNQLFNVLFSNYCSSISRSIAGLCPRSQTFGC